MFLFCPCPSNSPPGGRAVGTRVFPSVFSPLLLAQLLAPFLSPSVLCMQLNEPHTEVLLTPSCPFQIIFSSRHQIQLYKSKQIPSCSQRAFSRCSWACYSIPEQVSTQPHKEHASLSSPHSPKWRFGHQTSYGNFMLPCNSLWCIRVLWKSGAEFEQP